jgi:hypothetical protein
MNRRKFGLLANASAVALLAARRSAFAQSMPDASLLTTTLTPLGAERAGNAVGTIPAWTGGFNTVPANWNPNTIVPDFWASDPVLYTVDASNMAQYADMLADGIKAQIQNSGLTLKVRQTRRTACAPQWVYDNTAKNVATAKLNPAGGRVGFSGAFGGTPFPIPDPSDTLAAGAQLVWNHFQRWNGSGNQQYTENHTIEGGKKQLTATATDTYLFPYYDQSKTLATFSGLGQDTHEVLYGPSTVVGEEIVTRYSTNPVTTPDITWELLQGQGRVRKAPEIQYDTPDSFDDGLSNYDESSVFAGPPDEYDWHSLGKKEMLIPYNCNALPNTSADDGIGPKFLNPDFVRWELHRVWVVEATLHPGRRNVLARRRYYIDEDSWTFVIGDCFDANNAIYHLDINYMVTFPNMPGVYPYFTVIYNIQSGDYAITTASWGSGFSARAMSFKVMPDSYYEPQAMAANASY